MELRDFSCVFLDRDAYGHRQSERHLQCLAAASQTTYQRLNAGYATSPLPVQVRRNLSVYRLFVGVKTPIPRNRLKQAHKTNVMAFVLRKSLCLSRGPKYVSKQPLVMRGVLLPNVPYEMSLGC